MPEGYAGKDFLLKIGASNGTGTTPYVTVGGMRGNSLSFGVEMIDVTNKGNMPWRTQIAGGVKSLSISGDGVWNNDPALQATLDSTIITGVLLNWQVVCGDGDTYTFAGIVTKFERTGPHDKEETFSVSIESSGAVTKTNGA